MDSNVEMYLQISKQNMMTQYNKNVRYFDYKPGNKVWVRKRHYKTGESRKLARRYTGPYTVIRKMPNAVNFEIKYKNGKLSIIHHNRLKRVNDVDNDTRNENTVDNDTRNENTVDNDTRNENTVDNDTRNENTVDNDTRNENNVNKHRDLNDVIIDTYSSSGSASDTDETNGTRRYSLRNRPRRIIEGAVPWDAIDHLIDE